MGRTLSVAGEKKIPIILGGWGTEYGEERNSGI